eukprot:TRINITY_DN1702_c0_g1_i2.p1 TRINITY_DN1702_c0_g1~~TRINITY_DN1702_c0_g1_i2.p1  ORF type:complete len:321 (+),score=113.56 TRINITY_DN1702_c0_g1_i2:158-1120(+)
MDKASGRMIGTFSYKFTDKLGSGSYGEVFRGVDTKTNQLVAIKVLAKKLLEDDYVRKSLINEIDNMKKVRSQHVVQFIDMLHTAHNIYIITEHCNGGDLSSHIEKQGGTVSEARATEILREIIDGYRALYSNNIIHRDIKPQNILLNDGACKLADFGFSKTLQNYQDEKMVSYVGSPLYMAPQILKKGIYTNKCDIWSIGVMGFMFVFGSPPWPATDYFTLMNSIDTMPLKIPAYPAISDSFKDFLQRSLMKNEEERMSWEELFNHPVVTGVAASAGGYGGGYGGQAYGAPAYGGAPPYGGGPGYYQGSPGGYNAYGSRQ